MGLFSGMWDSIRDFFTGSGQGSDSSGSGSRLYVGNLSYKASDDELRGLFAKYGRVKTLHLIKDKFTRKPKGYAFVEMSVDDAKKALALNGVDFLGRKLVVSIAKSRSSNQPQGASSGQPSGGQGGGRRQGGGNRFRRRRSGPRAYGQKGAEGAAPIERLE